MTLYPKYRIVEARSILGQCRSQGSALLAELKNTVCGSDAVVIGEPHRAFYGQPARARVSLFEHYDAGHFQPHD